MKKILIFICIALGFAFNAYAQDKPRVVILTDIGRPDLEPDDTESLVHLLCYADMLEIEGIITSTGWNCDPYPTGSAAYRDSVVEAYATDVNMLMKRSGQRAFAPLKKENGKQKIGYWPSAEYIRSRCKMGSQCAGIGVIGKDNDTEGSELIIRLADEKDDRPIWVCAWGGANTLAQAIWKVQQTRTPEQLKAFLHKLRLFTITDQDMVWSMRENLAYSSHQWMRREFKDDLLFIWDEGTWNEQCELGKRNWDKISTLIQGNGHLGEVYPTYLWGVEGDTPSYLHVMPNGLSDPDDPTQVSWGGYHRYGICPDRETTAWTCWEQPMRKTSIDYFTRFYPDQLNDFIARIQWARDGEGNRNPVAAVNQNSSVKPLVLTALAGKSVKLDASESYDPDGDALNFSWWQQAEAGEDENGQTLLDLGDTTQPSIKFTLPDEPGKEFHIICEIHDDGPWNLVSYKRVIIKVL